VTRGCASCVKQRVQAAWRDRRMGIDNTLTPLLVAMRKRISLCFSCCYAICSLKTTTLNARTACAQRTIKHLPVDIAWTEWEEQGSSPVTPQQPFLAPASPPTMPEHIVPRLPPAAPLTLVARHPLARCAIILCEHSASPCRENATAATTIIICMRRCTHRGFSCGQRVTKRDAAADSRSVACDAAPSYRAPTPMHAGRTSLLPDIRAWRAPSCTRNQDAYS